MADVTVAVRAKPGAGRTRVGGRYDGSLGPALVIAVTAPPVDGRATEAVRRALAEALAIPAASVALRSGASGRDKLFTITSAPPDIAARLTALRDGVDGSGA
jgi:uncharacterized protein YggU (UPF0235/DUF167 family)